MISIKEIAIEAGMSIAAVSSVLNGMAKKRRISKEKADLILKIASAHNYKPNFHAKALLSKKTYIVGVITQMLSTSFFGEILAGLIDTVEKNGYRISISYTKYSPDAFRRAFEDKLMHGVDAIACIGEAVPPLTVPTGIPVILSNISKCNPQLPTISVDEKHGITLAAEHIISSGHRKICVIFDNPEEPGLINRLKLAQNILKKMGAGDCKSFAPADAKCIIEEGYTAALCITDYLALKLIGEMKAIGCEVPVDISIVGYDDLDFASMLYPSLTTVRQPKFEYGQMIAKQLLMMMDGNKIKSVRLRPELILRKSTRRIGGQ